jgi:hypothetical protein
MYRPPPMTAGKVKVEVQSEMGATTREDTEKYGASSSPLRSPVRVGSSPPHWNDRGSTPPTSDIHEGGDARTSVDLSCLLGRYSQTRALMKEVRTPVHKVSREREREDGRSISLDSPRARHDSVTDWQAVAQASRGGALGRARVGKLWGRVEGRMGWEAGGREAQSPRKAKGNRDRRLGGVNNYDLLGLRGDIAGIFPTNSLYWSGLVILAN